MSKHAEAPGHRPGWCIHFRSMGQHDACAAGMRYDDLRDGDTRPDMTRSPCFIKPGETAVDRAPCALLRPPTPREIAEYNVWKSDRVEHLFGALHLVEGWVEANRGKAAVTTIPCPACGSDLHVAKAASNDHTRGQCSRSALCIGWIQ